MFKRMMHPDPLQWGFASSPAEEATMRKNGWVDDAPIEVQIVAVETPKRVKKPTAREVLQGQADALGLKVDGRWSDSRLAEEIAKAK